MDTGGAAVTVNAAAGLVCLPIHFLVYPRAIVLVLALAAAEGPVATGGEGKGGGGRGSRGTKRMSTPHGLPANSTQWSPRRALKCITLCVS